jgi:hypothetical protein
MKEMISVYKENIDKFDNEKPTFNIFIEEVCTEKARLLSVSSLLNNENDLYEKKERAYTYSEDNKSKKGFGKNGNDYNNFNQSSSFVPKTNPLQNINLNK